MSSSSGGGSGIGGGGGGGGSPISTALLAERAGKYRTGLQIPRAFPWLDGACVWDHEDASSILMSGNVFRFVSFLFFFFQFF